MDGRVGEESDEGKEGKTMEGEGRGGDWMERGGEVKVGVGKGGEGVERGWVAASAR